MATATAQKEGSPAVAPAALGWSSFGDKKPNVMVVLVPMSKIRVRKGFNPRSDVQDKAAMAELRESIAKQGMLELPIVRPDKDGYTLVSGERRYLIAVEQKRADLPVQVRTDLEDDSKALSVALAANSGDARTEPNAVDLGNAFQRLADKGWSVPRIAGETGYNQQKVRRFLSLVASGNDKILARVADGSLPPTAAVELSKLDGDVQSKTLKQLKESLDAGDVTLRMVKETAKTIARASGESALGRPQKKKGAARDASLVVRRGARLQNQVIAELSHMVVNAGSDEVGTSGWFELRGQVGALLWVRGDSELVIPPAMDDKGKIMGTNQEPTGKQRAASKTFNALLAAEANNYVPADDEGDGDDSSAGESAD
jgi:ParB-like chromosome segregation protein Spo0J